MPLLLPIRPKILRRRRSKSARRGGSNPMPPPPPPITVVSVTAIGPFEADWEFSAPVSLSGSQVPGLEIDAGGLGFVGPDSVIQVGPTTLRGDYSSSSGLVSGDAWRILTQPATVSPALAVPMNGTIISA
jgi:hypothetical protein